MRVAIVNDLRMATEALRRVVLSAGGLSVAWTAENGEEAVQRCAADRPDAILMDMIMPVMDGVEATRRIMRDSPCPILVVTATVDGNASRVYEALGHGALDAVNTPTLGLAGEIAGGAPLLRKLEHIRTLTRPSPPPSASPIIPAPRGGPGAGTVIAIGASTGGPQALATVLAAIPRPCLLPILVVQHLGAEYVAGLGDWLARQAQMPYRLVVGASEPMLPGTIHLAAREAHLVARGEGMVGLAEEPRDHLHRPSVDVLFRSLAERGERGVAALLTGMGQDGARGLGDLRRAGWWTIAQDKASSVVWGMPGEAVKLGAACVTLPLEAIGPAIGAALRASADPDQGQQKGKT
jgi:two-component system response regulator WspF